MKAAEVLGAEQTEREHSEAKRRGLGCVSQLEGTDAAYQQIEQNDICEAPKDIHDRGGKPLSRRLGERALKWPPHHAADEVRHSVGQKRPAKEIGQKVKPGHQKDLSSRAMMSSVDPVSPNRGNTLLML
jgi:hypothetical protein